MRTRITPIFDHLYQYQTDPEAPATSLVMLSGGVDSTAALIHQLTQTPNQVHAHHIQLDAGQDRSRAEGEAVGEIVRYCRRKYRPLAFTTSHLSWPRMGEMPFPLMDSVAVAFVAGGIARLIHRAMKIDGASKPIEVVTGGIKDDYFRSDIGEFQKTAGYRAMEMAFGSSLATVEAPVPKLVFPIAHMTKAEAYQMIPPILRGFLNSCRRPSYIDGRAVPCGFCHACRAVTKIARAT